MPKLTRNDFPTVLVPLYDLPSTHLPLCFRSLVTDYGYMQFRDRTLALQAQSCGFDPKHTERTRDGGEEWKEGRYRNYQVLLRLWQANSEFSHKSPGSWVRTRELLQYRALNLFPNKMCPTGHSGACNSSLHSSGGTWVPPVKYHFLTQVVLSDHIMGDLFLLPNINFSKSRGIRWGQQERTYHQSNNETDLVIHAHVIKKIIPSGKNHLTC